MRTLGFTLAVWLAAAPAAATELGARLDILPGPKSATDFGPGSWGVLTPWVSHRLGESRRLQLWAEAPVVMYSPAIALADTLGGIRAGALYPAAPRVGLTMELAYLSPGALHVSPYSLPTFGYRGDLSPGVAMGFVWVATGETSRVQVAPKVVVQRNSDLLVAAPGDTTGVNIAQAAAQIAISGSLQVSPAWRVGLSTGAYTGNNLEVSPDRGFTVPVVASVEYRTGGSTFGLRLGAANVTPPDTVGIGDTIYGGLFYEQRLGAKVPSREERAEPEDDSPVREQVDDDVPVYEDDPIFD